MDAADIEDLLLDQECKVPEPPRPFIKCPFRGLCVGGSGSGKSLIVLRDLVMPEESPNRVVIWCAPSASLTQAKLVNAKAALDERAQEEGRNEGIILVACDDGVIPSEVIDELVDAAFAECLPSLLVFDDLVSISPSSRRYVASCFMNMRHRLCSVLELRQRIFSSDGSGARDARLSCNLFMLGHFSTIGEVARLADQICKKDARELFMDRYDDCMKDIHGFFVVDMQSKPPYRFRKNGLTTLYRQHAND